MQLKRSGLYIKAYFACAWLQQKALGRTGPLPEPRSLCMLMRMYVWGILSLVPLTIAVVFVAVVFLIILGIGLALYKLAFDWHTPVVQKTRLGIVVFALALLFLVGGIVGIWWVARKIGAWFERSMPKREPAPEPEKSIVRVVRTRKEGKEPAFSEVFGQWLEDLDRKTCTRITLT